MNERAAEVVLAATANVAGVNAGPGQVATPDPQARWAQASQAVMRAVVARVAGDRGISAPGWREGPAAADVEMLADLSDIASWSAPELGDVYEVLLEAAPDGEEGGGGSLRPSGRRRTLGAYYTPSGVAAALASFALALPTTAEANGAGAETPALVLDPACGAGVMLVEAARAIAARCRPRPGLLAHVIGECVFGVDDDPVAVDLARAALWLELEAAVPIACLERNVVCGDALAGASLAQLEERLVTSHDPLVILGNPPYRDRAPRPATWPQRRRRAAAELPLGPDMDDFLPEGVDRRQAAEHIGNSYVYFWRWAAWKALETRMSAEGVVGLVTPSAWLTSRTFAGMRAHLRRWAHRGWVVDLSPEGHRPEVATRIFPGVQIPLCLGVFVRLGEPDPHPAPVSYTALQGDREAKVLQLGELVDRAIAHLGQRSEPRSPGRDDDTNDDMEVIPMGPRMIPIDGIRIVPGHNARDDVGDLSDLVASIKEFGVLQALTVVEYGAEDGRPVYDLVAGERRLTAAREAGLHEVPCLVMALDDQQRVTAMLIENLQREDLSVLEEARGIRRLVERGLSQREIAGKLGCGQSHVSKRLALLGLPEQIQAAIDQPRDAGGITVAEALELTKLAGHPKRQMQAFIEGRNGYPGVAGMVKTQLAGLARERTRDEVRSSLKAAGVRILKEQDYYSWTGMRERPLLGQGVDYAAVQLTVEAHEGEPCHAAAIDRDGNVILVCADPRRHPDVDPKTAAEIVQARQQHEEQREENRLRREAAAGRKEAMQRVLAAANTSQLAFAARQITAHWRLDETKTACSLLGLAPVEERGPYGTRKDYQAALSGHAGGSMKAAIEALLALALACGEAHVGSNWISPNGLGKRHMELLAAAGHQPNDSDRKHLTGERDSSERICRLCFDRERDLVADGREWVDDPESSGDLCSGCAADLDHQEAI